MQAYNILNMYTTGTLKHFSSRILDLTNSYIKKEELKIWFQEKVFKVKLIIHPGSGSQILNKFIPDLDTGVKKHWFSDPGSVLVIMLCKFMMHRD
jgi:hypothetical protein